MALIDLKTNLNDWKFGVPPASDRPNSGNSGQPYIKKGIDRNIVPQSEDFLWRGGLNAPLDAATDVARLTKFFFDLKSPNGLLFTAKQNILSRIGVATQASGKLDWKKATLNEGTYTPLNTIAQAGVNFIGSHLYKQGLNPLKGLRTYSDVIKGEGVIDNSIVTIENNRLVKLFQTQIPNQENDFSIEDPVNLYSYSGGPNSNLGIGKTHIKFATDNKGAPLLSGLATKDYQSGLRNSGTDHNVKINGLSQSPIKGEIYRQSLGVSNLWLENTVALTDKKFEDQTIRDFTGISQGEAGGKRVTINGVYVDSITNPGDRISGAFKGFFPLTTNRVNDNGAFVLTQQNIIAIGNQNSPLNPFRSNEVQWVKNTREGYNDPNIVDFTAEHVKELQEKPKAYKKSSIISISPSYEIGKNKTIEGKSTSRIHQISPGQKGNILSYTKGKVLNYNSEAEQISVVDQINFQPIYKSSSGVREDSSIAKNDLVKFRIGAMLRDGSDIFTHFRAFINKFSDSYNSKWDSFRYMGRGEDFYKYNGFGRKISLSFTVAAQSKPELMAQYKKLNFIASTLAPDYGGTAGSGYMGGVLNTLTLGGWCYELPGFIGSLTLDVPQESSWDISINDKGDFDKTVKEMPHIVNVDMDFTPIHSFTPELQDNTYEPGSKGEVSKYGKQKFIQLKAGGNDDNYDAISLKQAQNG